MHQTIGIINGEVDSTIPIKETETELVIPAILAREGVLSYAKGNMLRSKEELQEALFTFNKAWVTAEKHPEPLISIITDRKKQIKGDLTEVRLDADAVMPNGKKSAAVKANVHLIKKTLTPQFIDDIKTGRRRDVSVGFLFDTVDKKGNWQGEPYDFVQENILINHVAVGVPMGRMRAPFIGLGCDQADFQLAENLLPQEEKRADEADSTWDYAYVKALPDSAFAYIDPDGNRHMPFKDSSGKIDRTHLAAALAALGGARQAGPPPYADKAKPKLCAAVRQWNKENPNDKMASTVCDITADVADCADMPVIPVSQSQPEPTQFTAKDVILPLTDQSTGALVDKINRLNSEQLQRKRRNPV